MTAPTACILHLPRVSPVALLLDSPHSGMTSPVDFVPAAPRAAILSTWDAFIDELWADAPEVGATLVAATFPRAYVDANRAADDIDPDLLAAPWPEPLTPTAYTRRGMGLIRRNALPDVPMYDRRLSVSEVAHRITTYYRPYRETLRQQVDTLHARFGAVWHLDRHSMKSRGNAMNVDAGAARPDFVIGDRRGTTADPAHTTWVAEWFRARGHSVQVNDPYQGGDIWRAQGRRSTEGTASRSRSIAHSTWTRHRLRAARASSR